MKLPQRTKTHSKPKSSQSLQGRFQVEITGLNHQGQGVTKIQGKTVFVEGAIPGDQAMIQISKDDAQLAHARTVDLLQKSKDRVEPFCRYFGECGGCRLQMQTPSAQVACKESNLVEQLKRHLDCRKLTVEPPFQAQTQHYRRRAKMVLVKDKTDKTPRLGFKTFHSDTVIDIEDCPILTEGLNRALSSIRFELLPKASRQARDVFLLETEQGVWVTSDIYQSRPNNATPYYQVENLKLEFESQGFIQVHGEVNRALVQQAINWLAPQGDERVLDLFCGVGNFTLPLAQKASLMVGVEGDQLALNHAKMNAQTNGLTNIELYQTDLFKTPDHQAWWSQTFDAVLLDPGRLGAKTLCEQLGRFEAKRIVYVSCQSATLIRDLQSLQTQGYRLKRAQVFDMFPHTDHFETLVLLERRA
jgi:23S rRNA (uracil1939-C5)-methyltransferase